MKPIFFFLLKDKEGDLVSVDTIGPHIEHRNKTTVWEVVLEVTHLEVSKGSCCWDLCSSWNKSISFYFIFSDIAWILLVGTLEQRQAWAICTYVATTLVLWAIITALIEELLWAVPLIHGENYFFGNVPLPKQNTRAVFQNPVKWSVWNSRKLLKIFLTGIAAFTDGCMHAFILYSPVYYYCCLPGFVSN